jgi:hypothetical protein
MMVKEGLVMKVVMLLPTPPPLRSGFSPTFRLASPNFFGGRLLF